MSVLVDILWGWIGGDHDVQIFVVVVIAGFKLSFNWRTRTSMLA
jgi:hypothetical protein